ncbi:MAG TPA: hypothetical protein VM260_11625 [Pirellula sp.]|nr:hypothetical protein [Pirellula sp.]
MPDLFCGATDLLALIKSLCTLDSYDWGDEYDARAKRLSIRKSFPLVEL